MPTVNELPDAARVAALLTELRERVRDLTARERRLRETFAEETRRLERREQSARQRREQEAAEARRAAEAEEAEARSALETRIARRAERLEQAAERARQFREQQVEDEAGRVRYQVQRDQLRNSRDHERALKEAEERHEAFLSELGAEEHVLATLEARAADALAGYGGLARRLRKPVESDPPRLAEDPLQQLDELRAELAQADRHLTRVRRCVLPQVFRYFPLWLPTLLLVAGHAVAVYVLPQMGRPGMSLERAAVSLAASLGVLLLIWLLGRVLAGPPARALAAALNRARRQYAAIAEATQERHAAALARIEEQHATTAAALEARWAAARERAEEQRARWRQKLDAQLARARQRHARLAARWREAREAAAQRRLAALETETAAARQASEAEFAARRKELQTAHDEGLQAVEREWRGQVRPLLATLTAARPAAARICPPWDAPFWRDWSPATEFAGRVPWGTVTVDLPRLTGGLPEERREALAAPERFDVPLLLGFPQCGSVLFETGPTGREAAVAALNNLILRLLALIPPGKLDFTLVDPVELGQSFAGFMHLTDYEEQLINGRIWTQTGQIEDRLADLNGHVEKVTQMYLRNDYASIVDYNRRAGRMAEKYRFLVVADFPHGFSELAARRLLSILASGPRCGVYVLLHRDRRQPLPVEMNEADLRQGGVELRAGPDGFRLGGAPEEGTTVTLDAPPARDFATDLLHRIGRASVDAGRVEVPFAEVAPAEDALWSATAVEELRVPIGVTGATKRQELALGRGTRQHVLVAGKTGSGKSNLFHVMITNLALWHGPDQVEFYLVDFKKGVEFKCYATHRLPHARVVAIESDREFGLSVLRRVDEELRRRGELFRTLQVQDLAGYHRALAATDTPAAAGATKRAVPREPLPRTLLLIDEFQEFFTEDDRIAQNAALLLDRIVRQGRAFGIHVVLGSQTLGGAYTLARSTLGQMVVRVALQCNEADAYLIMDEDNPAPRLLSRPGEAIYNDAAGMIEGNSPFQVVWLDEQTRDRCLEQIRRRAEQAAPKDRPRPAGPVVFEGNAPADVAENAPLRAALAQPPAQRPVAPRAWLGAPNAIKGPTAAVFARQSGRHLLLVGQRDESILALLGVSLISLAAQHPVDDARFVIFSRMPGDSPEWRFLEQVTAAVPQETRLARGPEVNAALTELAAELDRRSGDAEAAETAPAVYVFLHELPKFKELRPEDEFSFSLDDAGSSPSPAGQFQRLIQEGAALGVHLICTCDSGNSLARHLNRKALGEFDLRVVFQMSANDSAMLIDSPRANQLGLHRALFHDGQQGILETFRPYALPTPAWLEAAARHLHARRA